MERRVLRRTAIDLCASCKTQGQKGCKKEEIETSKDGKVIVPPCMINRLGEVLIGQKNIFEFCQPATQAPAKTQKLEIKDGWKGFFEIVSDEPEAARKQEPEKEPIKPKPVKTTQKIECTDAPFKNWDETYTRILHCIKDHHTIGSMAKVLSLPRSTIRDRLTKLEEKEIIAKTETMLLGNKHKTFIIISGWAMNLVNYNEVQVKVNKPNKPEPVKFTRHFVTLQAEILSGTIPKGDRSYSPNGWTGEIFDKEGKGTYIIRVIPNKKGTARAAIDINICLGATSVADLTMRYHTFAEKYLGEWAAKHNLKIGQITEYRTPHTPIEGSKGLAKAILGAVGGETKLVNFGVQVDESDKEHKGEIEFTGKKGEQSLRNFEFALNQAPEKMEQLASKFDALQNTLHSEAINVGDRVSGIQAWLILQHENDLLREQSQLLREQVSELGNQIKEMKSMLGLTPPTPNADKKLNIEKGGMYG